ncbi:flagellar biosynthesis protein FlhF [Clostridium sp. DJ247]|uniref:flagellar biosynthesis protein FlhF n=1 Tax=Clostridium sp. DJ247 TaxID=2726188 RepID=UPI00162AB71E|nr:flagellar biosynthesis protein FlhF [Clostridium sp. DJ247]MBC2580674.1 flagellar biosynthesis protein FlhF [Clostridium sp. DJ247]MBC2580675.1 flagellar biosynthesis protein FlhF [Clostridium sp. DJ247]
MIVKRYRVNNMNEAVTRIRYELGKDAVIVSQRKVRKKGLFGIFSKKILEVTAVVDNKEDKSKDVQEGLEAIKKIMSNETAADKYKPVNNTTKSADTIGYVNNGHSSSKVPKSIYNDNLVEKNNSDLIKEVQEMRTMLSEMMTMSNSNQLGKSKLQIRLESYDFKPSVIKSIISKMNSVTDDRLEEEKLKEVIEDMIKIDPKPLGNKVVLVGPTGVGKTTTIAKLAGKLALIEGKNIGLITIDTYRIGAVEQLRTYADIMNIPFRVVLTIKEMEAAIDSMKHCDVILIDTTGRSSKNAMQISELRAFIDKVETCSIHLVISCTTKNKDIDIIVNGYKPLNYNSIIITKLDETSTYGSILNIQQSANKPISFVTTGQNVPEDLKILTAKNITNVMLGEDTIC